MVTHALLDHKPPPQDSGRFIEPEAIGEFFTEEPI